MNKISFTFNDVNTTLRHRKVFKNQVISLLRSHGKSLESLHYIFCTDDFLLQINNQFLKHSDYTDIITFDLSEIKNVVVAEIYISVDRVKENAALHNKSFQNELLRVMFHGVLHLCGMSDKTTAQKKVMRQLEDSQLDIFFKKVSRTTVSG